MDSEISEPEQFWNGEYLLFERMKLSFARGWNSASNDRHCEPAVAN